LLEELYVKTNFLSEDSLSLIQNAVLKKEEIEKISEARSKREIAQYSVTKNTTSRIAEQIKADAYEFVNKSQELL